MNRLMRGSVLLAVAVAVSSCTGDPTDSLRAGAVKLIATPAVLFVPQGDSAAVLVEAVDAQGNRLTETLAAPVSADPGVVVSENPNYNNEFQNDTLLVRPANPTRVQFYVKALTTVGTTFTVTDQASGKAITVPVKVVPKVLTPLINNPLPAIGDTVTITAQAGLKFDPASVVSFAGGGAAVIVQLAADSSFLKVIPIPGSHGKASVTKVNVAYAPTIGQFTLLTPDTIGVPAVTSIPAVFASATPNVNDLVTVTAAGFKFLPSVSVRFGNDVQLVTAVAADSSSFTFRAHQAGASGTVTIGNAVLSFLTGAPLTVPAINTVTVGATVTELTGTDVVGTAPAILLPTAVATTGGIVDAPTAFGSDQSALCGGPCNARIYKFTVGATKVGVNATWNSNTDIGVYLADATGSLLSTTTFPPADNLGSGPGGHPETTTWTLPAGSYTILVIDFLAAPAPTSLTITFTGQ
jgi:hypothetical protein